MSKFIDECAKAAQAAMSGEGHWDKIPASQDLWRAAVAAVFAEAAKIGPPRDMYWTTAEAAGFRAVCAAVAN